MSGGKGVKNHAASVRALLLQHAKQRGHDFQRVLTYYAIERFLYRLSQTTDAERFVLKGSMLFATWPEHPFRATHDLDLLGHGDPDAAVLAALFSRACAILVPIDGVAFDVGTLAARPIREQEKYPGVRVTFQAALDAAIISMQVDVGFGDHIYPSPTRQLFPTLLDHLPAPSFLMYPPETVIAEKFEAMISKGLGNTRLKDFFDVWTMTRTKSFELSILVAAIGGTLRRRGTAIPAGAPAALTGPFADVVAGDDRWSAFMRRAPPTERAPWFPDVQADLRAFFGRVVSGLAAPETASGRWDQQTGEWRER